MTHTMAVTNCNIDMESLISDQNRSIATLAVTTLLKTCNESGVDRLMKQIMNFMSDIADEFKIVVVDAIRSLCLKFPLKYRTLMIFLSNILRQEGGFEYKKAIVDSIVILIRGIPDAKESGLLHLCEFIEDCEFTSLSTQLMNKPRCLFRSASLGKIAIVAGGIDPNGKIVNSAELYNSKSGFWERLPDMLKKKHVFQRVYR